MSKQKLTQYVVGGFIKKVSGYKPNNLNNHVPVSDFTHYHKEGWLERARITEKEDHNIPASDFTPYHKQGWLERARITEKKPNNNHSNGFQKF